MTDWDSIFSIYFFSLFDGLGVEIHLLINPERPSLACVCAYAPYKSFRLFAVTSVTLCGVIASLLICWGIFLYSIKEIAYFCRNKASKRCVYPRIMSLRIRKTSTHFTQNDVLFYEKWRVVLLQTTYRFEKVTCCFSSNDVSFYLLWNILVEEEKKGAQSACCDTCDSKKSKIL